MTSVLAQQLRKVSLAIGNASASRDSHASLLYSAKEAADIDTETVFTNSIFGLEQLAKTDVRFLAYRKSLYSASTLSLNRGRLTQEELASVNKSISSFLRLLAPHFLHQGCFKALEYLIRKYRVHVHNVEELLAVALPFHATNQFVRLVQTAQLENTLFVFLKPMQTSGASLPRASLVKRCKTDKALLRLICDFGKAAGNAGSPNRFSVTLYAVLVCELLMASKKVDEDTVGLLLPFLLHGVGSSAAEVGGLSPDYRAATRMIFMQLCSIATLAKDFLEVLMQQLLKNAAAGEERQILMALCHAVNTQPQLTALPKSVVKGLTKMPEAVPILESLESRKARMQPLLRLLLAALTRHLGSQAHCKLLFQIVNSLSIGPDAQIVAAAILRQLSEHEDKQQLRSLFRTLDLKFPAEVDAAINDALKAAEAEKDTPLAEEVGRFVGGALSHSARSLLEGSSVTVAHAVDAPAAQLRVQAVKQLETLVGLESEQPFVRSALLRRLTDDDPAVLEAVIASPALGLLPPEVFLEGFAELLRKAREVFAEHRLDKAGRKALREVVRKALHVMAERAEEATEARTAAELLNFMIGNSSTKRISAAAVKLGSNLAPLSGLQAAAEEPQGGEEAEDRGRTAVAAANLAAVKGLAQGFRTCQPGKLPRIAALAAVPGKHALLLALNAACQQGSSAAAESALEIAEADWAALDGMRAGLPAADDANFDSEELPTEAYLDLGAALSGDNLSALLRRTLLGALRALPDPLDSQRAGALFLALSSRQPVEAFQLHLEALVAKMGSAAALFLADIFALPPDQSSPGDQARALELLPNGISQAAGTELGTLIPRLLTAMMHPVAAVRTAALRAAEDLPKALEADKLTAKQLRGVLDAVVRHSKHLQSNAEGLPEILKEELQAPAVAESLSTKRRNSASKQASAAADRGEAFSKFLLQALPAQRGPAGIHSARAVLRCLSGLAPPFLVLQASVELLEGLLASEQPLAEDAAELVKEVWLLFTPQTATQAPKDGFPAASLAAAIYAPVDSGLGALSPELRAAAIRQITPELYAAVSGTDRPLFSTVLMLAATHDSSNEVRKEAHQALEGLQISAEVVQPCLFAERIAPPTPAQKRTPKRAKAAASQSALPTNLQGYETRELLTAAVELLQWKVDLVDSDQLLQPLSGCLAFLLSQQNSLAAAGREDEEEGQESRWSTSVGYLIQLALNALLLTVAANPSSPNLAKVDLAAVVDCTVAASGAAARNSALQILATLTGFRPQQTLSIALEVITAVGAAARLQADAQSQQTAVATLRAVCPAWVAAGRSAEELARAAIDSSMALPVQRALPLLGAIVAVLPEGSGLQTVILALLQRAAELIAEPQNREAGGLNSEEALTDLASLLCHQVSFTAQLTAFAELLEATRKLSGDQPEQPLAVLAVALVATEVRKAGQRAAEAADLSLQRIVQSCLHQLQVLSGKSANRSTKAALAGTTRLLEALQFAMPAALYIKTLLALLGSSEQAVKCRALGLFEAAVAAVTSADGAQEASHFCEQVTGLVGHENEPRTRRAALAAFGALAAQCGRERPAGIVASLPAVVSQIADSSWAVRTSALAAISAAAAAAGSALLPALPRTVPAVLSAADAAMTSADGAESSDGESSMEVEGGEGGEPLRADRHQAEAQAAVAAVKALVEKLGQFLSPHLPDVLALLLRSSLLESRSPAAELAAETRRSLTGGVPARLLLPALAAHLDAALGEGTASAEELLRMAGETLDKLKPLEAASHADSLWAVVLRALELRQSPPASVPAVQPIEEAAIRLLVKLTLKLSEMQFKPRFLRLLDWAAAVPATGERGPERQVVLFKAVAALAEELRGVFVPYFRHLLDLSVLHLGGSRSRPPSGSRKKRRKSDEQSGGPDSLLLQLLVVKALHKCFLYDRQEFLTEAVFNQLLGPLVGQLGAEVPTDLVESELPPAERRAGERPEEGLDAPGQAVVDCLVQMAATANKDYLWKPLHHQVLMASRSENAKERRRALEVVVRLADRLGEEYVVLLPEAMPFLAELLEDPEVFVQNETRKLLLKLEELTGESLDQYLK